MTVIKVEASQRNTLRGLALQNRLSTGAPYEHAGKSWLVICQSDGPRCTYYLLVEPDRVSGL